MRYELYTLNGKVLLDNIRINYRMNTTPVINFCDDVILSSNEHEDNALFYQLKQELAEEIKIFSADSFEKIYFYIDFNPAFPLKSRDWFDMLFNDGFLLDFGSGKIFRFVPFLSSQSQSKNLIFAFIREDIFKPLQKRLDLDIDFEKNIENKSIAFLPKLYSYRALYMSSSTEVFRCSDTEGAEFFNCENIIVLPEKVHNLTKSVNVFTAIQAEDNSINGEAVLSPTEEKTAVSLTCFDGEGIMTPRCRDLINKRLSAKMRGNSFQIRMPFLKGVLHTVNFHSFLRDKGVTGKQALVKDIFGVERDLFKANIIIRPSAFKLHSLIADRCNNHDFMKYYFEKMFLYNHGLYVVKTEAAFHNTNFVRLSSQQLSTLDLKPEDIDGIIKEHIEKADAFCPEYVNDPEKRKELFAIEDKADWMELLLKEPRFINDPHIQTTLKNHRVSRYNDIALGRVLVSGENRFLSGDLYVFLIDLLENILDSPKEFVDVCSDLKKLRLYKGGVYLPGGLKDKRRVALVRSPHLSRNEDVCTTIFSNAEYEKYLGHLNGVVIVGDNSYIPSALGGADFDGDHISIIYDERIINACHKSGYVETKKSNGSVPFIHIKELKSQSKIAKYNYVSSQAVYNSFNNRIGNISNAAMKIAAVEYDESITKAENTPKAAFCTILTGNEIDSTKKGVRPYIDSVINFSQNLDKAAKQVVEEIEKYIKMKREIESRGGEIPRVKREGEFLVLTSSQLPVKTFAPNRERNAVAQLLYRWANAFLDFKPKTVQVLSKKAACILNEIFNDSPKSIEECEEIFSAYIKAVDTYSHICNRRMHFEERIKENNAKITVRLSGQYDDIYAYSKNEASYKEKFENLQNEIYELTEEYGIEELEELVNLIFSEKEELFNPKNFWPYSKGTGMQNNQLLAKIMQTPNADLLLNFEYEGYRLLNYLLNNIILERQNKNKLLTTEENFYERKYIQFCYSKAEERVKTSSFEKKLADLVLKDLAKAEGVDLRAPNAESILISRIYPLKDTKSNKAFWKIFTEKQVICALGGDDYA